MKRVFLKIINEMSYHVASGHTRLSFFFVQYGSVQHDKGEGYSQKLNLLFCQNLIKALH